MLRQQRKVSVDPRQRGGWIGLGPGYISTMSY
jgi:hypothetical protein